jgi:abequosyltransferase
MPFSLSICIPTFNRVDYLSDLLESLECQVTSDIEIVVSDNASTDGTQSAMLVWQKRLPNLVYKRWDTNRGADRNYLSVVDIARGEYCWFLGSDDIARPDAVSKVVERLKSDADCLIFSRMLCSKDMSELSSHSYWKFEGIRFFDFSKIPLADYLEQCNSIAGVFSYLSSIVFRRRSWNEVSNIDRLVGTAYAHADILIRHLAGGGTLLASTEVIVNCRCGNDSFSDGNKGKRLSLDFDGYKKIGVSLPNSDNLLLMGILIREHPWRNLLHILRYQAQIGQSENFMKLIGGLGVPQRQIFALLVWVRSPLFQIYAIFIEPWQKAETPWVKLKRRFKPPYSRISC